MTRRWPSSSHAIVSWDGTSGCFSGAPQAATRQRPRSPARARVGTGSSAASCSGERDGMPASVAQNPAPPRIRCGTRSRAGASAVGHRHRDAAERRLLVAAGERARRLDHRAHHRVERDARHRHAQRLRAPRRRPVPPPARCARCRAIRCVRRPDRRRGRGAARGRAPPHGAPAPASRRATDAEAGGRHRRGDADLALATDLAQPGAAQERADRAGGGEELDLGVHRDGHVRSRARAAARRRRCRPRRSTARRRRARPRRSPPRRRARRRGSVARRWRSCFAATARAWRRCVCGRSAACRRAGSRARPTRASSPPSRPAARAPRPGRAARLRSRARRSRGAARRSGRPRSAHRRTPRSRRERARGAARRAPRRSASTCVVAHRHVDAVRDDAAVRVERGEAHRAAAEGERAIDAKADVVAWMEAHRVAAVEPHRALRRRSRMPRGEARGVALRAVDALQPRDDGAVRGGLAPHARRAAVELDAEARDARELARRPPVRARSGARRATARRVQSTTAPARDAGP